MAATNASTKSKLRYPLRSASRSMDGRIAADASTISSERGRGSSCASKSVNVSVLSVKDKFLKGQKLSNSSSKPTASLGSITPISEARTKRANTEEKNSTPNSQISSTNRRKFDILTSASYWLTQIKFAEYSSKHSISLGFFKLAMESGCEPLQRMREELKSYAIRHNLVAEEEELTKDLFNRYDILDDFQKLKISPSALPLNTKLASNEHPAGTENLKSWPLNSEALNFSKSNKKQIVENKLAAAKNTASKTKNQVLPVSAKDDSSSNQKKKSPRQSRVVSTTNKKSFILKAEALHTAEKSHEDKENMDASIVEAGIKQDIGTS